MKILLLIVMLQVAIRALPQNSQVYDNIPVGKHGVGFRIITIIDSTRVTKPLYNYFGEKEAGDRYRKISIHLWYPARPNTGGELQTYSTYMINSNFQSTRDTMGSERKRAIVNNSRNNFQGFFGEISDSDWSKLSGTKFLARADAASLSGPFPLLIGTLRPFSTSATNEMLASNGYVVAMIAGSGGYPMGYINEVADLQHAMKHISRTYSINPEKIGTFGFSGSGFVQVLFAMNDPRVSALADIESGLYMGSLWEQLSSSNYYNARQLKIPFLHLFSKDLSKEEDHFSEFEKNLKYADRYRVLMNQPGLHHWDFALEGRLSTSVIHIRGDKEPGIRACYELANLYLLQFFNAVLKDNIPAKDFLSKKQPIARYQDSMWSYIRYPGLKASPNKDQFKEFILRKGIDSAVALARNFFSVDSGAEFIHQNVLNQLSYNFRQEQKVREAKALLSLATEFHPQEAWVWNNLGSLEEDYGDKEAAIKASQKVLEILDHGGGHEPSFDLRIRKSAADRLERLKN